ncbi:MAG: OmpA family protein, partial [Halobacteria archaeon]|nr:OmpA family protein [Halobacteria archaeon]
MFHIEGVKPGSHVVQMDLDTLAPQYEPVICDEHSRFAGRSFSRFVDLQGGTLWRTDFHVKALPPPTAEVELQINSTVDDHVATYHLGMRGGNIALDNMRLMVNLPKTTQYIPGSSVLDDKAVEDPEIRGTVLIYKLGKVPGNWSKQLNFLAKAEINGETALLPSKAFLLFNTPSQNNQRTPVAETLMKRLRHEKHLKGAVSPKFESFSAKLTAKDKKELKRIAEHLRGHKVIRIEATGHTDNVPVSKRSSTKFADNLALSIARARSVGEYLLKLLNLPDTTLVVNGMGANIPFVPNRSDKDRAQNRRVELHIVTETMLDASQLTDVTSTSNIEIEVEGEWQNQSLPDRKTSSDDIKLVSMPKYDKAWAEKVKPGVQLLWPQENYNPPIPSIRIAVQ